MKVLRAIGRFFWRFMVVFSFVVNLVLLIVVIGLLAFLFNIKNDIAAPLITGLHSSFVGLDEATIDWTIPVRATVPVNLDIPLSTNTVVTLTEPVPLSVTANIVAPGLTVSNATVTLELPQGLNLPVALNLGVEVRDQLPVALDVRAVIPLQDTQLHDVAENLRLLFEPLAVGIVNLPNDWNETFDMVGQVLRGEPVDLLAENAYSNQPWPGFSRTAGLNYPEHLLTAEWPQENVPVQTGITMVGGIAAFDEPLRPQLYQGTGGPLEVNAQARASMTASGVPQQYYDGSFNAWRVAIVEQFRQLRQQTPQPTPEVIDPNTQAAEDPNAQPPEDLGIIVATPAP